MVTFANLGSVRLPSLKFVGLRLRKIRRILCVSYNSFPVIRTTIEKIVVFTYHGLHFFVCPGDAPAAFTQNVAWMKKTI